jgi:hypothetical protein
LDIGSGNVDERVPLIDEESVAGNASGKTTQNADDPRQFVLRVVPGNAERFSIRFEWICGIGRLYGTEVEAADSQFGRTIFVLIRFSGLSNENPHCYLQGASRVIERDALDLCVVKPVWQTVLDLFERHLNHLQAEALENEDRSPLGSSLDNHVDCYTYRCSNPSSNSDLLDRVARTVVLILLIPSGHPMPVILALPPFLAGLPFMPIHCIAFVVYIAVVVGSFVLWVPLPIGSQL